MLKRNEALMKAIDQGTPEPTNEAQRMEMERMKRELRISEGVSALAAIKAARKAEADERERAEKRLRDAAPELLEALKDIIDYAEADIDDRRRLIDSDDAEDEVEAGESACRRALAAIARAEGRT